MATLFSVPAPRVGRVSRVLSLCTMLIVLAGCERSAAPTARAALQQAGRSDAVAEARLKCAGQVDAGACLVDQANQGTQSDDHICGAAARLVGCQTVGNGAAICARPGRDAAQKCKLVYD